MSHDPLEPLKMATTIPAADPMASNRCVETGIPLQADIAAQITA